MDFRLITVPCIRAAGSEEIGSFAPGVAAGVADGGSAGLTGSDAADGTVAGLRGSGVAGGGGDGMDVTGKEAIGTSA